MQIISEFNTPITNQVMEMYNYFTLDNNDKYDKITTNIGFTEFMQLANDKVYNNRITFVDNEPLMLPFKFNTQTNKVVVGYSSGFDSTYQALKLKHDGYEVVLLHCNDLNKSYPDEKEKAREFANYYNIKLVTVDIKHDKTPQFFIDNPIKNQLILSLMIDYGIANNINTFALGNNIYENITECRSQYGISDSIQNFDTFRKGIAYYIENINFYDVKEHKHECYKFVAENYHDAFQFVNSCISPHRFKRHLNKKNREKYNINTLSDSRCMSCYKCAIEYIILSHYGFTENSQEYINRCYDIIRKKSDTIFTTKISDKNTNNNDIERNIFNA